MRPSTLAKYSKGRCICLHAPPAPHIPRPPHKGIRLLYPKRGHTIVVGLLMLRVRRRNPLVGSEPPRAIRARDEATQGVASGWHIRSPIEGTGHPQASYLSPHREVSFMPLCVGWHRAIWVFPLGLPRKEA
jgi:hypothetical protein